MAQTQISPSALMATGNSRGTGSLRVLGDNSGLRSWLAEELTAEVQRTKDTGEPLDQGKVESLIQRMLLVDLSELAAATGREKNHALVNEKLKAFAAWRSSGKGASGPKKVGDDDELTEREKEALGKKAK